MINTNWVDKCNKYWRRERLELTIFQKIPGTQHLPLGSGSSLAKPSRCRSSRNCIPIQIPDSQSQIPN